MDVCAYRTQEKRGDEEDSVSGDAAAATAVSSGERFIASTRVAAREEMGELVCRQEGKQDGKRGEGAGKLYASSGLTMTRCVCGSVFVAVGFLFGR